MVSFPALSSWASGLIVLAATQPICQGPALHSWSVVKGTEQPGEAEAGQALPSLLAELSGSATTCIPSAFPPPATLPG